MKRFLVIFVMGASALALSACNTFHGFGRDVSRTGEAIEDASSGAGGQVEDKVSSTV